MNILSKITSWKFIINALFVIALIVAIIHILAFSLFDLSSSMFNSINFSGFAADGPFQIYNPLRRLAAGQIIGRDFQFFHGLGIPLFNYPLFHLLGSNVFASEFTRWILSYLTFISTAFIFFKVTLRSYRNTIIATSLALLITLPLADVIFPSNSLVGIRSAVPIIFASVYLLNIKRTFLVKHIKIELRILVLGILAAVSILMGTEQGFALIAGYFISELLIYRNALKTAAIRIGSFILVITASLILLFALITHGHPLIPLKYMLDASRDQSWYFGTAPQDFLSWHRIITQLTVPFMMYVYALLGLAVAMLAIIRKFILIDFQKQRVYVLMVLYGLFAFAMPAIGGYYSPGQSSTLVRVLILVLVSILLGTNINKFADMNNGPKLLIVRSFIVAGYVVYFFFALAKIDLYIHDSKVLHPLRLAKASISAISLDDYQVAAPGWKAAIDSFDFALNSKDEVWSTYASLYESQASRFQPSAQGHDYIIHALGKDRRYIYENQFVNDKPRYVITLKQSYFPFEEWLWQRHWKFYKQLLDNYTIVENNASHRIWQINDEPVSTSNNSWININRSSSDEYVLPQTNNKTQALYEIKINYSAFGTIPLTGNLPKYLLKLSGSGNTYDIALPPSETSWEFPVSYFKEVGAISIKPVVDGIFPGKLKIHNVMYREMPVSNLDFNIFTEDYCYKYLPNGSGVWKNTPLCREFVIANKIVNL